MIQNPIHLRLAKLSNQQLTLFMVCLCERMYPNFAFYCQQIGNTDHRIYKNILDLIWETLLVKNTKINFDNQLEKLEEIIPLAQPDSVYSVYPAIDACQALSELLHANLSGDFIEFAVSISQLSLKTIAELEMNQTNRQLSIDEIKTLPAILDELDIQWEIYRLIKNDEINNGLAFIKGLKQDLREDQISNIGVFLSN